MNGRIIVVTVASGFVLSLCSGAFADDVKISTYYPSPQGTYKNLDTTEDTHLATSSGRVGIGTEGPDEKLHVAGGNMIVDSLNGIGWGNRSVQIIGDTTPAATYLRFDTAGGETMRLNNSGNLGIGTAAAAGMRLDVNGTARANAIRVSGPVSGGGAVQAGMVLTATNGNGDAEWKYPTYS